jgi:ABC-2 type transport system ATP-binding protein
MSHQEKTQITVQNVSKTYSHSNKPALLDVSLVIAEGDRVGLVGSNGSGKTTLLRLLMNFISPDCGTITIKNLSNLEDARRFIGYVGESQSGLESFTPRELFETAAKMYGMNSKQSGQRATELLAFSGLDAAANELIAGFSKGMAQRAFIGLAIVHEPEILLLDEPMSGLDQKAQDDIRDLLRRLTNKTLVYASHNLDEIEEYASSVVFMHEGRIVQQLQLAELNHEVFLLKIDRAIKPLLNEFDHLNARITRETSSGLELKLTADSSCFQDFIDFCRDKGIHIHRIRSSSLLEDLYDKYVRT